MKTSHLDYEGRSGVDITEVGSHRWSIDPRFEIFMASVSRGDDDRVLLWINPKFRLPDQPDENAEAERILAESDVIYAHNAQNEQANTWGALQQGKACPFRAVPPLTKWRCTAAMARKAGLPHALGKLSETLGLTTQKDKEGKALITFFCMPDEETGRFNEPKDHPEKWLKFCAYCVTDTVVEKAAHRKLKAFELTGAALATFQFDLRMNQRGIPINLIAARNAQKIIDREQAGVTEEFRKLTGLNPTQREKIRVLVGMPNMQAETVENRLDEFATAISEGVTFDEQKCKEYRILQMFQKVSYAAVKKVQTMLDCACPDGFIRGTFMYYGAATGRWTAQKLQPHNFKKTSKEFRPLIAGIYDSVCRGCSNEWLELVYGEPLECLANAIRSFIQHPTHQLFDGDFNAIEGRIGAWIAGQHDIVEAWRRGEDLYKRAAAFIENVSESSIQNPSPERDFGKVVELACQFGLGIDGFIRTCDKFGIGCDEKKAHRAVKEYYRPTHDKIVDRWWVHDRNMRQAIKSPGTPFGIFTVRTIAGIPYMLMRLPSGRAIAYPWPQLDKREPTAEEIEAMEDGKQFSPDRFIQVSFWGEIRAGFWGRVRMWGSLAFQNEVQGIATDFMAHGALVAEARGMAPFMLVHDQGLAVRTGAQTVQDYERALGDLPAWAAGFPMRVEAKTCDFYKK